jgi:hypothetical protein
MAKRTTEKSVPAAAVPQAPGHLKPHPLDGYFTEDEMREARDNKSRRAMQIERQRGLGPPWVKVGRRILYPIAGWRRYLIEREHNPVREHPQLR